MHKKISLGTGWMNDCSVEDIGRKRQTQLKKKTMKK